MKRLPVVLFVLFALFMAVYSEDEALPLDTKSPQLEQAEPVQEMEPAEQEQIVQQPFQPAEIKTFTKIESVSNEDAYADAIADANASAYPMVWGVSGFLSSCLLAPIGSLLINLGVLNSGIDLPGANIYTSSAMCCLGATLISYISTPAVPASSTRGRSTSYTEKYRETYASTLKNKNTLYTFAGGTLGFLLASVTLYVFVMSLFLGF